MNRLSVKHLLIAGESARTASVDMMRLRAYSVKQFPYAHDAVPSRIVSHRYQNRVFEDYGIRRRAGRRSSGVREMMNEARRRQAAPGDWLMELQGRRVVTIGGGTGPFALLSRLKTFPCLPTAIVTMSDSGGSSRRLMDEFGQLPFGDLRQALVALSRNGVLWREIFGFRFASPMGRQEKQSPGVFVDDGNSPSPRELSGVSGHSLGNLIISALQSINAGDLLHAILDAQELLDTAGNVLPVTLSRPTLCAELSDGTVICGETDIDTRGKRQPGPVAAIVRVFLVEETQPCADAIRAIRRADVIVIGPGDLYTSIVPNLLVEGVAEAIGASEALKVYVCNLMTKHGETDGFRASDFVNEVHRYLACPVDRVILHDGSVPQRLLELYALEQQCPVEADSDVVRRLVPEVVLDRFVAVHGEYLVRHDADRLIPAIFKTWIDTSRVQDPPPRYATWNERIAAHDALA